MKPVLLVVLEVPAAARTVLQVAEIQEATVGEQTRRVRLLVDRRPAHFLQAEAGEHLGLRQHLSGLLVGHGQDDFVRDLQARMVRVGQARGPDGHVDKHPIRVRRVVPEEKFVRL